MGPFQEQSFNTTKALVWRSVTMPTSVSAGARGYALGGMILQHRQKWKPVTFCSRTLTAAEQRYAQTERVLDWGVGLRKIRPIPVWSVTVQTVTRPHNYCALDQQQGPRQHPYDVPAPSRETMRCTVNAEYSPRNILVASDALSRSPINDPSVSSTEDDANLQVHLIESNIQVSPGKRSDLHKSTRHGATLQPEIDYTLR